MRGQPGHGNGSRKHQPSPFIRRQSDGCAGSPRRRQVGSWTRCQRISDSSPALPWLRDCGQANVLGPQRSALDMERRTAWIHADEAKGGEAIGVSLNDAAVAVLRKDKGKHLKCEFTFKGKPLGQARSPGGIRLSVRASATPAGTTCGTSGPRGTSWRIRRADARPAGSTRPSTRRGVGSPSTPYLGCFAHKERSSRPFG